MRIMALTLLALSLSGPLATFSSHAQSTHSHAPSTHVHGAMELNIAMAGNALEVQFTSPALDLLGFEHLPTTDQQQEQITQLRSTLTQPIALFSLQAASCQINDSHLSSALFDNAEAQLPHNDVQAHYRLHCTSLDNLTHLDVSQWFKAFPKTEKISAQLILPTQQLGASLTAKEPRLELKH